MLWNVLLFIILWVGACYRDIAVDAAACGTLSTCKTCTGGSCEWCATSQACVTVGSACDGSPSCGKVNNTINNSAFQVRCSSNQCSTYSNCFDCNANGCGWCEEVEQCMESQQQSPIYGASPGPCFATQPTPSPCSQSGACWKSNFGQYTTLKCASKRCSSYTTCRSCAQSGCGWCEETQSCLPLANNNTASCSGTCAAKNLKTSQFGFCPAASCASYTDCKTCAQNGCGWCDSSQLCGAVDNTGKLAVSTCAAPSSNTSSSCLKVSSGTLSIAVPLNTQCASCSAYANCYDCTTHGCGWCDSTQQCAPVSTDGKAFCDSTICDVGCLKTVNTNSACSRRQCSEYDNCFSCQQNGCGWCDTNHICQPINTAKTAVCGATLPCANSSTCLKAVIKSTNPFISKCPTSDCGNAATCQKCVASGCGWCSTTSTCQALSTNGDTSCQYCDSSCWKTNIGFTANRCPIQACSSYLSCGRCALAGCGWNATLGVCGEIDIYGENACAVNAPTSASDGCYKSTFTMCPAQIVTVCQQYPNCSDCIAQHGCAWCPQTDTCLELNKANSVDWCGDCDDAELFRCPAPSDPVCTTFDLQLTMRNTANYSSFARSSPSFCTTLYAPANSQITTFGNDTAVEVMSAPLNALSDFQATTTLTTSVNAVTAGTTASAGVVLISDSYWQVLLLGVKNGSVVVQSYDVDVDSSPLCYPLYLSVNTDYVDLKIVVVNFQPTFYARSHSSSNNGNWQQVVCSTTLHLANPQGQPGFRVGLYAEAGGPIPMYAGFTSFTFSSSNKLNAPLAPVWLESMTSDSSSLYFGAHNVTLSAPSALTMSTPSNPHDFQMSTSIVTGITRSTTQSIGALSLFGISFGFVYYAQNGDFSVAVFSSQQQVEQLLFSRTLAYVPYSIDLFVIAGQSVSSFLFKDSANDNSSWALIGIVSNTDLQSNLPIGVLGSGDSPITITQYSISYVSCPVSNSAVDATDLTCVCSSGYSGDATQQCTPCDVGSFSDYDSACSPCPIGSFSNTQALGKCFSCEAGYSTISVGGTSCTPCSAGEYSNMGSACLSCAEGTYSRSTGSIGCFLCPIHQYSTAGSTSCTACGSSNDPLCSSALNALLTTPTWGMPNHDLSGTKYLPSASDIGCTTSSWIYTPNTTVPFNMVVSSGSNIYASAPYTAIIFALNSKTNPLSQLWKKQLPIGGGQTIATMIVEPSSSSLYVLVSPSLQLFSVDINSGNVKWSVFVVEGSLGGTIALQQYTSMVLYSPIGLLIIYTSQLTGLNYVKMVSCTTGLSLWQIELDSYPIISPIIVTIGDSSALIVTRQLNTTSYYPAAFSLQTFSYLWTASTIRLATTALLDRRYVPAVASTNTLAISAYSAAGDQLLGINLVNGVAVWRQPYAAVTMAYNPSNGLLYIITADMLVVDVNCDTGGTPSQPSAIANANAGTDSYTIFSVDNKPSLYVGKGDGTIARISPDGSFLWSYKTQYASVSITFDSDGVPFVPGIGGISSFPCIVETESKEKLIVEVIAYCMSAIKFAFLVFCFVAEKLNLVNSKSLLKVKKWRISVDVIALVATSIVSALAQIPINVGIDDLVNTLQDPVTFKNTYLESCTAKATIDPSVLCFCQASGYYQPTPGCGAASCGVSETDCPTALAQYCLCDYSFYEYNCGCTYSPNVTDLSCVVSQQLTSTPKPYVQTAFNTCYTHYKTISNMLWVSFALNIAFSFLGLILGIVLGEKSKVPLVVSGVNLIVVSALIIAAAVQSKSAVCQSVPNSGLGASGAYDTASQFTPGCIFTQEFDAETSLLTTIGAAILVLANKPIQALLSVIGLIALPATFLGGLSTSMLSGGFI